MISPSIQMLYDEHEVILAAIERVNDLLASNELSSKAQELEWFVKFFREYGDGFHHKKEEDILFSVLEREERIVATDIMAALTEHHEMFREDLQRIQAALSDQDWDKAKERFGQYLSNLRDHISAENDEFFISAEQALTDREKESLYFQFLDKDRQLGEDRKRQIEERIMGES